MPYRGTLYTRLKDQPDLYGPLWTYITLVYVATFFSNAARYLANPGGYTGFNYMLFPAALGIVRTIGYWVGIWTGVVVSAGIWICDEVLGIFYISCGSNVNLRVLLRRFHSGSGALLNNAQRTLGAYRRLCNGSWLYTRDFLPRSSFAWLINSKRVLTV